MVHVYLPVEMRKNILDMVVEGRSEHDLGPNTTLPSLALVNKCFRYLAQKELYSRVYVGPTVFERPLVRTIELLARTLIENVSLAALVVEIHTGTMAGGIEELRHLETCIVLSPNLRLFELRGWPTDGIHEEEVPAPPPPQDPFWPIRPTILRPPPRTYVYRVVYRGYLDAIFLYLLEKPSLRALILSPKRLLQGVSPPLWDRRSFITFMNHLTNLDTVILDRQTIGRSSNALTVRVLDKAASTLERQHLRRIIIDMNRTRASVSILDYLITESATLPNAEDIVFPKGCNELRRLYLGGCLTCDSDFDLLSEVAPNISELSVQTHEIFRIRENPSMSIAPALRVWSPHLVKLVLPDYHAWPGRYTSVFPERISEEPNYTEVTSIADVITQMPSLRVLGISRELIAPQHFRRGPDTLVSLNYIMAPRFLDSFAAVLEDPACLPNLCRVCFSVKNYECPTKPSIDAVLEARDIELYETDAEWEAWTDELDLRE